MNTEEKVDWWKDEKIFFQCQKCGKCCKRRGVVKFDKDDIRRAAQFLELSEDDFKKTYLRESKGKYFIFVPSRGKCLFQNPDDTCRIQDAKPSQCSAYPFWPSIIDSKQHWTRESIRCRGIGKAKEIDMTKIVPNNDSIDKMDNEMIDTVRALISCNENAVISKDGRCYSQDCLFNKNADVSFKIKKNGCTIYREAQKYDGP